MSGVAVARLSAFCKCVYLGARASLPAKRASARSKGSRLAALKQARMPALPGSLLLLNPTEIRSGASSISSALRLRRLKAGLLFCVLLSSLFALTATEARAQATCATPGQDGAGGNLSGIVNTYYPGSANANAGATSISIGSPSGASTPITNGNLLLVIQMQEAVIDYTNSDVYGDGVGGDPATGSTSIGRSGTYEYVVATGSAGATVSIRGAGTGNGLINSYRNAAASGTRGQRRFQVIRIPQYSSATLTSGLTALAWDGRVGGILAIDVSGALALGGATVSVNALGFRGGGGRQLSGSTTGAITDYVNVTTNAIHGMKGEGIAGTPHYVFDQATATVVDTGAEGYPGGDTARGAPGNAGGGGTDGRISNNERNSGGGGGANGNTGGIGGNTWNTNLALGGFGGSAFPAAANLLVMGGGGGAGSRNNSSGTASSGAAGGGIVMMRAGTIAGTGTITANGADGSDAANDGGGGGGAGGSILVVATGGGLGSLTARARGGNGGDAWPGQAPGATPGERHGPGGGGSGGVVALNGSASVSVTGGTSGTTTTIADPYGATSGGTGIQLSITASQVPGASAGGSCLPPVVALTKSVTPNGTQLPGTDLIYTINFSNTGGNPALNLVVTDPDPAGTLRLDTSTYFKIGSVTSALGTTGLTLAATYSNNDATTFTYTPVSGAGGAPAGYDGLVTHVRLSFTGNLSQTTPNNAGSVSFTVRIK